MKNNKTTKNSSRYAVTGIGLSVLSVIALLVAVAMKVFETIGIYTPNDLTFLPRLMWGSAGGILIGLAIFALLAPKRIRSFLTGRQAKYGSNALVTSIAFIGIIVLGNVLAYQNPVPLDWTVHPSAGGGGEPVEKLQMLDQSLVPPVPVALTRQKYTVLYESPLAFDEVPLMLARSTTVDDMVESAET